MTLSALCRPRSGPSPCVATRPSRNPRPGTQATALCCEAGLAKTLSASLRSSWLLCCYVANYQSLSLSVCVTKLPLPNLPLGFSLLNWLLRDYIGSFQRFSRLFVYIPAPSSASPGFLLLYPQLYLTLGFYYNFGFYYFIQFCVALLLTSSLLAWPCQACSQSPSGLSCRVSSERTHSA